MREAGVAAVGYKKGGKERGGGLAQASGGGLKTGTQKEELKYTNHVSFPINQGRAASAQSHLVTISGPALLTSACRSSRLHKPTRVGALFINQHGKEPKSPR